MNSALIVMLYFLGTTCNRCPLDISSDIDSEKIRDLAIKQEIWPLVYPALSKVCDVKQYQPEFWYLVSDGIKRREVSLNTIQTLQQMGVDCCLLKGAVVSQLYPDPDLRISSDTDILINPADEEKVKDILTQLGYEVFPRSKNDHHMKAKHKTGGLLEVHVELYSHITKTVIFNNMELYNEPWRNITIGDKDYKTLGVNDGLMYLTAHYIKHLINEGGGIRQMMDLLLYIKKYESEIDFDRYNSILKELKYDKLIDTVKSIGAKYWGMDFTLVDDKLMDDLLSDTEKGGIFGYATDERKGFYNDYCAVRSNMSRRRYNLMADMKAESSVVKRMFPSKKVLVNCGFGYAKFTVLIPIAWSHRLIKIAYNRICHPESNRGVDNSGRLELMRRLGMID